VRSELLDYYERELIFLRRMGADFARRYPKIAARLLLDEEKVEDPHVERMIEAFAFLTARIGLKLDDELPEITESFLNVLFPHQLAPIPSLAIAQFVYGSSKDKLSAVQVLKRGSRLNSRPVDGTPCQFRTAYDVPLTPIEIQSAALESPAPKDSRGKFSDSAIRISLRCYGDAPLSEMNIPETGEQPKFLRFYIDGDPQLIFPLYEMIFNHVVSVEFKPREAPLQDNIQKTIANFRLGAMNSIFVPAVDGLKQVGFKEDEAIVPYTKRSFAGYRLLTEYFAFPYKFLFFDVYGLDEAIAAKFGSHFDILIHLKDVSPPAAPVTVETFKLGCTPVVNLFQKLTDPLYISQQQFEYHVLPDVHRQLTTEIYSIDEVYATDPETNASREFSPFYSLKHAYGEEADRSYWYGSRRQSQRADDPGTEIFISLVDNKFNPTVPAVDILNVKATCSNRDLPARLPFGGKEGDFEIEGSALLSRIRCLTKPTETIRPPLRRGAHWRLISQLNLNYLSIIESADGVPDALREILHLYNLTDSTVTRRQILGLTRIECRRAIRQIGERVGTGFVRGIETILTFDEEQFVGTGMFLFACIIERFLGLYVSLNSFNQVSVRSEQREEIIKSFPARSGEVELS
jgi:type VI secretion system protein ImpG